MHYSNWDVFVGTLDTVRQKAKALGLTPPAGKSWDFLSDVRVMSADDIMGNGQAMFLDVVGSVVAKRYNRVRVGTPDGSTRFRDLAEMFMDQLDSEALATECRTAFQGYPTTGAILAMTWGSLGQSTRSNLTQHIDSLTPSDAWRTGSSALSSQPAQAKLSDVFMAVLA